MLYLAAELLLRIQAAIRGEQLKPTDYTYLPWDLAAEEDLVMKEKMKYVKDFESTFYKSMPEDAAQCIKKSLELNWQCRYDLRRHARVRRNAADSFQLERNL